jgi:selenocysteine-specific elongation factor
MATEPINITLGTAGHIDHGKTALIKLLTGCDTDTLKAEKQRGMSIDLGFAACTISNLEIGIVDVPGHENFIKTMVAGASGIDGVIFVIAADDGVMPQTREHLDIITLLGVEHGIVALTKVDCIEQNQLQTVTAEIKDFLVGTFLQNAPILPISSITGQGFEDFYEALKKLVKNIKPKKIDEVFRLPVERTFSLKGYGTVVTGIPVSGSVKTGDEVVLLPQTTKGRIKAIQVYKRDSDTAVSGQCAALNIPQWDYKTIKRGNVVTVGEYFSPQQWYLCKLHVLDSNKSEVLATIYLMQANTITAGQQGLFQVRVHEPVVAAPGDRFILRTLSPVQTVGGGMIIEAISKKLKRSNPQVLQDAEDRAKAVLIQKDFVEYCIKTAEAAAISEHKISLRTKLLPDQLREILKQLTQQAKVLKLTSKLYIHSQTVADVQQQLLEIINNFHRTSPESPGITAEQLHEKSKLQKSVFDGLVKLLISQRKLVEKKHRLALPTHSETFTEGEHKLLETVESLFRERPFNPPKRQELIESTSITSDNAGRILRILIEQERIVQIENNLLFHRQAIEQARQILTSFIKKEGMLESVKFKYLLDTTRKFAIPLLDYFDRIGVTRRVGNTRYLKSTDETTQDSAN